MDFVLGYIHSRVQNALQELYIYIERERVYWSIVHKGNGDLRVSPLRVDTHRKDEFLSVSIANTVERDDNTR